MVGSITNYQKETKFHELNEVQKEGTKYNIIRNGKPGEYISDDILVGDLIMVNYGDSMAADLLLIEGNGIKMDESALTGESDAMKKEPYHKCKELQDNGETKLPSPLILSGTNCIEGSGRAIVLAVGDHSQKGIIRGGHRQPCAEQHHQTGSAEALNTQRSTVERFRSHPASLLYCQDASGSKDRRPPATFADADRTSIPGRKPSPATDGGEAESPRSSVAPEARLQHHPASRQGRKRRVTVERRR